MKRGLIGAIGISIAVCGCATVDSLRKDPPAVALSSEKSPAAVGQCIASGWGEFYGVSVNQSATADGGYTVNMPSQQTGNNGVADITPTSHGSRIEVRYRLASMGGYDKFTGVVQRCS